MTPKRVKADILDMPYQPNDLPEPVKTGNVQQPQNLVEQNKKNKPLLVLTIIFSVVIAAVLAVMAIMLFSAPQTTSLKPETPRLAQSSVPTITDFKAEKSTDSNLTYKTTFSVPEFESESVLEYKIENNKTRVLAEGVAKRGETITQTVTIGKEDTSLRLIVRLNDGIATSPWITQTDAAVEGEPETKTSAVNEKFYTTPWALNEDATVEALNEALKIGLNAMPYDQDNPPAECYGAGDSTVQSGDIVAPTPAPLDGFQLYFITQQVGSNSYQIVYAWCA